MLYPKRKCTKKLSSLLRYFNTQYKHMQILFIISKNLKLIPFLQHLSFLMLLLFFSTKIGRPCLPLWFFYISFTSLLPFSFRIILKPDTKDNLPVFSQKLLTDQHVALPDPLFDDVLKIFSYCSLCCHNLLFFIQLYQ